MFPPFFFHPRKTELPRKIEDSLSLGTYSFFMGYSLCYYFLCVWVFCLCICLCTICVLGVYRDQRKVLNHHHVDARNQTWIFCSPIRYSYLDAFRCWD